MIVLFIYTCCLATVLPLIVTPLDLAYFIPFIVLAVHRCSYRNSLWWAIAGGFFVDCFSSQTSLGTYAFNYCVTAFCLQRTKYRLFEDRLSTLPLMTFAFCSFSNLLQALLLFTLGKPFHFSWEWVQIDLLMIPLETAIYAGIAYHLPLLLRNYVKKRLLLMRQRHDT